MKYLSLTAIFVVLLFSGCVRYHEKVKYNDKDTVQHEVTINSIVSDTTKVIVARLPVLFDSTDYLIHPIEIVNAENKSDRKFSLASSDYSSRSDYWSEDYNNYRNGDYIYGNFINLLFENVTTGNQELLTSKGIKITMVQFLRPLLKELPKSKYLLYRDFDKDSNHDGELNNGDITSLYISKIDGSNFKKLTKDLEEYKDGSLILQNTRYYFRTIEDTNKDGYFNNNDTYHYYFIDLSKPGLTPVEYFPLEKIKSQ